MAARRTKQPAASKKLGRPSIYTEAISRQICRRIALGEPLTSIVKTKGMPALHTIYDWLNPGKTTTFRPHFLHDYVRARQDAADTLAAQCLEIADDSTGDRVTVLNEKGEQVTIFDHANVQRSRLRFDARRWYASKLYPRRYADKVQQEVTGVDGGPIQTTSVVENAQARLAAIRARMRGDVEQARQGAPGSKPTA